MASITKWGLKEVQRFLSLYENHSVLWDINHEGFYDKNLRQKSFEHLFKQLQDEDLETNFVHFKAKIKNIRDIYRIELRRILKNKKQKKERGLEEEANISKVAWFNQADSFLRKSVMKREKRTNADYHHEVQTWISSVPGDIATLQNEYDTSNEFIAYQKGYDSSAEISAKSPVNVVIPKSTSSSLRTLANSKDHTIRLSSLSSRPVIESREKKCTCSEDPYDLFGRYVVAQIRGLPPRTSILLQQEIQQVITKAVLSCINWEPNNKNDER